MTFAQDLDQAAAVPPSPSASSNQQDLLDQVAAIPSVSSDSGYIASESLPQIYEEI